MAASVCKVNFEILQNSNYGGMTKCCNCKGSIAPNEVYLQLQVGSQRYRICIDCAEAMPHRMDSALHGYEPMIGGEEHASGIQQM